MREDIFSDMRENSKITKKQRHDLIIDIITQNSIETQAQLTDALIKSGFDVTQATISRDIKELRLIKIMDGTEKYCYALPDRETDAEVLNRYAVVLKHGTVSVDCALNLVVMKTIPGSAQGCAMAVETMHLDGVVGLIAGDDTIFIAAKDEAAAKILSEEILRLTS